VPAEGEFGRGFWGWWYFDHIQYRDEKVVFLSQFLPAGTYQYTYFLQPNIPGTYQVMPTTAREQYFPEVFGRSEGAILRLRSRKEVLGPAQEKRSSLAPSPAPNP
jgi:uncharacterized protein YfaS (alpha-2-macroglobulin family)